MGSPVSNLQVVTCSSSGCERLVISWRGGLQQQKLLSLIVCLFVWTLIDLLCIKFLLNHRKNGLKCCAEFAKMACRICKSRTQNLKFLAQNSDVPKLNDDLHASSHTIQDSRQWIRDNIIHVAVTIVHFLGCLSAHQTSRLKLVSVVFSDSSFGDLLICYQCHRYQWLMHTVCSVITFTCRYQPIEVIKTLVKVCLEKYVSKVIITWQPNLCHDEALLQCMWHICHDLVMFVCAKIVYSEFIMTFCCGNCYLLQLVSLQWFCSRFGAVSVCALNASMHSYSVHYFVHLYASVFMHLIHGTLCMYTICVCKQWCVVLNSIRLKVGQLSIVIDTKTRDGQKWRHFWKAAFSFSGWIGLLKTWHSENDGFSWKN